MLRPRTLLVAVLALVACAGTGYSIYLARELAAVRAQLTLSREGAEALQKKMFEAEQRAGEAAAGNAAGTPATPATATSTTLVETAGGPTAAGPGGPGRGDGQRNAIQARAANFMAEMLADPELGPMMMAQRKRQLDQRYAGLFRQLNLPPEQLEKLKTLLAEKDMQRNEAQALARGQGLGRDDIRATMQQADADSDAQIKSLIGDKSFEMLGVYEKTGAQRNAVNDFANRLSYGSTPLSTSQTDQLVNILAANPLPSMNGRNNGGGGEFNRFAFAGGGGGGEVLGAVMGGMGRNISDDDVAAYVETKAVRDAEVLKQAATVLNAAQLQALQQQQQEENNQIHLMTVMRQKARAAFPEMEQRRQNRRGQGQGGGG